MGLANKKAQQLSLMPLVPAGYIFINQVNVAKCHHQ